MISALLRYLLKDSASLLPRYYIQWHQILWFIAPGHSKFSIHCFYLVQEHPPLPLLAGVEGKLHLVSVGHTSMDTEMEQPLQVNYHVICAGDFLDFVVDF
jgi:hypothetical protein